MSRETAKQIFAKFKKQIEFNCQPSTVNGVVKQCAIIYVTGILDALKTSTDKLVKNRFDKHVVELDLIYWDDVLYQLNQM